MLYFITFAALMVVIGLMAIGVIFGLKPIQGSCGGLNRVGIERECNCETTCSEHRKTLYQIQEPSAKEP